MSELIYDIQEMAEDLRDPYGYDAETVKIIARAFQVPAYLVQDALDHETLVD